MKEEYEQKKKNIRNAKNRNELSEKNKTIVEVHRFKKICFLYMNRMIDISAKTIAKNCIYTITQLIYLYIYNIYKIAPVL